MHGIDAGVVELVTTDSDAHTMDFLFMSTEGGYKDAIGDLATA